MIFGGVSRFRLTGAERSVILSALGLLLHHMREDEAAGRVPRTDGVQHLVAMRDVERLRSKVGG